MANNAVHPISLIVLFPHIVGESIGRVVTRARQLLVLLPMV
ncbi:MAG: hypothetical protein ABI325_10570 [Ginsengibacter sp.]